MPPMNFSAMHMLHCRDLVVTVFNKSLSETSQAKMVTVLTDNLESTTFKYAQWYLEYRNESPVPLDVLWLVVLNSICTDWDPVA